MNRRQQEQALLRERIAAHRMLVQLEVALLRTELRSALAPAAAALDTGRGMGGWLSRGWRLVKWLRSLGRPAQPASAGFPWRLLLALVPSALGVWQWWRHRRG